MSSDNVSQRAAVPAGTVQFVSDNPKAPLLGQVLKTKQCRLELINVLNSGASGVVYEAVDLNSQKRYAVKHMPSPSLDSCASPAVDLGALPGNRLSMQHRMEATLHARCSGHPRVLTMHDAVYNALGSYLVLDYCPDGDLFSLICDVGLRGGEAEARRLFLETCQAVFHCHRVGVYHRDIKPENLLVQRGRDGRIHVVLADFGLATTRAWSSERGCGSVFYMSPECLLRKSGSRRNRFIADMMSGDSDGMADVHGHRRAMVDALCGDSDEDDYDMVHADDAAEGDASYGYPSSVRQSNVYSTAASDVWSLGIMLCNLASRRNPWRRADPSDVAYAYYLRDPRHALGRILPLTDEVHRVLRRALDPNPETRCTLDELYESVRSCKRFWADSVFEDVASVISAHDAKQPEPVSPPASPIPSLTESGHGDSTELDSDVDEEVVDLHDRKSPTTALFAATGIEADLPRPCTVPSCAPTIVVKPVADPGRGRSTVVLASDVGKAAPLSSQSVQYPGVAGHPAKLARRSLSSSSSTASNNSASAHWTTHLLRIFGINSGSGQLARP